MIELFKKSKSQYNDILEILESANKDEFYFTEGNKRFFITNVAEFKRLLNQSHHCYFVNDPLINSKGVILIWKSKTQESGSLVRRYVKIAANNNQTAKNLLNLLLWAYPQELYSKIKKNSPFAYIFKSKKFMFEGDRGTEILLKKIGTLSRVEPYKNKEQED